MSVQLRLVDVRELPRREPFLPGLRDDEETVYFGPPRFKVVVEVRTRRLFRWSQWKRGEVCT